MKPEDEEVLKNLKCIEAKLTPGTVNDFSIKFVFKPNDFLESNTVTKKYIVNESNQPVKIECSELKWKAGKKITDPESFFTFFTTKTDKSETEDGIDMAEDFEMGTEIKTELIPLALEYFLDILDQAQEGDEGEEGEDD